jgi:hypothetical protein
LEREGHWVTVGKPSPPCLQLQALALPAVALSTVFAKLLVMEHSQTKLGKKSLLSPYGLVVHLLPIFHSAPAMVLSHSKNISSSTLLCKSII